MKGGKYTKTLAKIWVERIRVIAFSREKCSTMCSKINQSVKTPWRDIGLVWPCPLRIIGSWRNFLRRQLCSNLSNVLDIISIVIYSKTAIKRIPNWIDNSIWLLPWNCWFSHDVTKIQTTKLSILLRFYFHGVLEQLKTNFQTNFRLKTVLGLNF